MYQINKFCISVLLLLIGSVFLLSAQVVTSVGGYPVVDLNNFKALGCTLTSSEALERQVEMNKQIPANDALMKVGQSVSGEKGTWNAKMPVMFQVMGADILTNTDWANAYTFCKQYDGEGGIAGEWRLPTQRELQMIWVLHPQIREISGFTPFTNKAYWSSTEYNAINAWYVNFSSGHVGYSSGKTYKGIARCVKDI